MAKTNPVNPNRPLSTGESPRLGDNVIRALAAAVAEILGIDHYIGADSGSGYTEDAAGEHKRIKFNAPISTPSSVANKGFLYVKDFSGKLELCFLDEDGDEIQLTSGGVFNPALACGLTGNQTIAGNKTFSGIITLGDTSKLATSAAPTADAQVANKKYVDDSTNWSPASYSGGGSVTFPNGMILKMGHSVTPSGDLAAGGQIPVSFSVAFPNAIISAVATLRNSGVNVNCDVFYATYNVTTAGFTFSYMYTGAVVENCDGFDWIAIGY